MLSFHKKTLLFLLFGICVAGSGFLKSENPLITKIELTKGDSTYLYLYYYNERGYKTLESKWVDNNDEWSRQELTEWIYDNNVCTEQHIRVWKNGNWEPDHLIKFDYKYNTLISETHINTRLGQTENLHKTTYGYTGEKLAEKTEFSWSGGMWVRTSEVRFSYNENNLRDTMFLRNYSGGILTDESKIEFTYNDRQQVKTLLTLVKNEDEWINSSLTTCYYSPDASLASEIMKYWDRQLLAWTNLQYIEYQYSPSSLLAAEKYQHWGGSSWVNDLQYEYRYNENGLLTEKITYLPVYNDFRPAWSVGYSNFKYSRANLIEAKNEFWGGEKGELFDTFIPYLFNNNEAVVSRGSRIKIDYTSDFSTVHENQSGTENQIIVYPNPSKAIFYFDSEAYDASRWAVTDLSGKTILSKEQNEHSGVIDLGDFESGIYLLRVFTPGGIKTQKLIKEKN